MRGRSLRAEPHERSRHHHRVADHRHDVRQLRGEDRARHRQGAGRRQGRRQPRHREGDGHLRPRRRLDGRPRRRRRGSGLRGGDRPGDPADHRHDLRQLREPGGEGAAHAARRPQGGRQPRDREGDRLVHPRPGDLSGPGRGRARRRLRRRRAGARHRRGGHRGGGRRRGGGSRRRLQAPQAQGHRRLRAQRHHLRRHHADGLVHLPARVAAQRVRALGPRQHRAVLGGSAVLHDRVVGAEARHHDDEHAGGDGLVGRVPLQRARRPLPRLLRASGTRGADVLRLGRVHHHAHPVRTSPRGTRQGPDRSRHQGAHRPAAQDRARRARRRRGGRARRPGAGRRRRRRSPRREGAGRRRRRGGLVAGGRVDAHRRADPGRQGGRRRGDRRHHEQDRVVQLPRDAGSAPRPRSRRSSAWSSRPRAPRRRSPASPTSSPRGSCRR